MAIINDKWAPYEGPFTYDEAGTQIYDANGRLLIDLRGWGYLTGKGSQGLGLEIAEAVKIQDRIGERIALLLNLYLAPVARPGQV